ncbi:molybdopterin-guanine dinucleotide biosynthesis protein B [Effusibacillus dendaii]|uniref:Molybdopterin-guanine dinucleotide biosynthesis protein B (MobB) domain-containing protein n=1 Tax=Effusibacillus dendaii TaxID=2743772 RepID=A0A7I8DAG9_9BACL|nr:molybdopterin-guanine dinucleotide biosynthesis protein B [Effusibacillus dendaii]BCJ87178.1 hypothetical protein skT53_21630 [Effusibacillus dendaii]
MNQPVTAFAVVGYKNTGKTTMVCKLVERFKSLGYRVGTIKSDAHEFQMDRPGADTFQHRQAGADQVAIVSPQKWALQVWTEQPPTLQQLLSMMADVDLVIVEGYKQGDLPKVVMADEKGAIFQHEQLDSIVAVAAKGGLAPLAPPEVDVYDRDDVDSLVSLLRRVLSLEQRV